MIQVLRATDAQRAALNGYRNGQVVLEFIETQIGFIVSASVLKNPDFAAIHDQLNELERVDYTPPAD